MLPIDKATHMCHHCFHWEGGLLGDWVCCWCGERRCRLGQPADGLVKWCGPHGSHAPKVKPWGFVRGEEH